MHFNTEKIMLRFGDDPTQQVIAHAEADLEYARRITTEQLHQIQRRRRRIDAVLRPQLVECPLLRIRHAAFTPPERADLASIRSEIGRAACRERVWQYV